MLTLKKLNRILGKGIKIKFLFLIMAIIIGATIEMLCIAILSPIIAILLDNSIIYSDTYILWLYRLFNFERTDTFLALLAFAIAFLYIFRSCYVIILNKIKFNFIGKTRISFSNRLLRKIIKQPYIFHSRHNIADFQKIIISDVNEMFSVISNLCQFLSDSFTSTFILIFLFTESPLMSLGIIIAASICISFYYLLFRKKIKKAGKVSRSKHIAMIKSINQAFGGIKEVKVLRSEEYFENEFKNSGDKYIKATQHFQFLNSIPQLYIEAFCFGTAFMILAFIFLSDFNAAGMLPLLSVFVFAAFRILPTLSRLSGQINSILYYRPSINAVYENLFSEDREAEYGHDTDSRPVRIANDIEVTGITYRYPKAKDNVLEKISLRVPEKCSVALIGSSGAGKTTLADIILGILMPQSGAVFYQAFNVHANLSEWSKHVGYIPQQIYVLDESIRQNVAFGIEQQAINDDDVWKALELAQLKDYVESLPEKLDTSVGDRGIRLSGGQRQRIGIARALYRDPPILILDEATSSLDSDTEKAVMESIQNFQGNKTMIIVAHRLSTIEHCDIVYRVEGKTVIKER